jgi:hypothetical protein
MIVELTCRNSRGSELEQGQKLRARSGLLEFNFRQEQSLMSEKRTVGLRVLSILLSKLVSTSQPNSC